MEADCTKPAGPTNVELTFDAPEQGLPTQTMVVYPPHGGTVEMREARIIAPDRIAFNQPDMPGTGTVFLVLRLQNGRLRTHESVTSSGYVLIKDGKAVRDGKIVDDHRPYTWERCRATVRQNWTRSTAVQLLRL